MRPKDWEYHAALLHKHDSAKFMKPTQRTARPADPALALWPLLIPVACIIGVIAVVLLTEAL